MCKIGNIFCLKSLQMSKKSSIFAVAFVNRVAQTDRSALIKATDVGEINSQKSKVGSRKLLRDGLLLIIRDGKTYNAQGVEVR